MKVTIFNIQKYCLRDGPGLRTTVFFAGCPLNCLWCHNPEGKSLKGRLFFDPNRCIGCRLCLQTDCNAQIFSNDRYIDRDKCKNCGECADICPSGACEMQIKQLEVSEIFNTVCDDIPFYGNGGGLTVSGGEPTSQPDALLELLSLSKEHGINTAIETCGVFPQTLLEKLIPLTDLFLWDYKDSDSERFQQNTGGNLDFILNNLKQADSMGAKIRLRCLLIHGINTTSEHADSIKRLAASLHNLEGVDYIPYHPMGKSKYSRLDIENEFDSAYHIPTDADLNLFK